MQDLLPARERVTVSLPASCRGECPSSGPRHFTDVGWTHTGRKSPTQGHMAPQRRALTLEDSGPSPAGKVKGGTSVFRVCPEGLQFSTVGSPCHGRPDPSRYSDLGAHHPLGTRSPQHKENTCKSSLTLSWHCPVHSHVTHPRPGRTEGMPIREDVPCSLVPSHQQPSLQP